MGPLRLADVSENTTFQDVLDANRGYASTFKYAELEAKAAKGLAILTCMDSRIDPLEMLGLVPGDAKILRNAGARVTEDTLRTLVLAAYLLGVTRVMVVAHTGCRMTVNSEALVHKAIGDAGGPDTRSLSFQTTPDATLSVKEDVQKIRSFPYLQNLTVGGFLYDLETGSIGEIC